MNRTEHLLACLSEECAEVSHRVGKALRFGLDEVQVGQGFTNAERISQEITDLLVIADILSAEGLVPYPKDVDEAKRAKRAKVERWMRHAEHVGTLQVAQTGAQA